MGCVSVSLPTPPSSEPPPRPVLGHRVALWWARRYAFGRLPYWLLTRAAVVVAVCVGLFIAGGVLMGWGTAYELLIGITSPAKADPQWAAWPLSVAGWAAIPAFIGGTAGYLITAQIKKHQARDLDTVIAELRALTQPPPEAGDGNT
ncbi:DUF6313 family protein [Streptomyces iakyrus]|uniref:DUF6313 family protein n=1 Tax=Streptomyces iakyrus TaxID=68219 RepID=UPI0033F6434E